MNFDQTWLQVDLDALCSNFRLIREKAGTEVMAVVKADAYGMGAVAVAQALAPQCSFFGTANIAEALELRRAGLKKPILVLGQMPLSAYPHAVREDIRMPIFRIEDAIALSQEAQLQKKTARFHFAVDTGMSRIGFQATESSADLCAEIVKLPGIYAEGIFSHFASADNEDLTAAKAQAHLFSQFLSMLKDRGVEIPLRHLSNSAGIMNFPAEYELVRSGIVTYGLYPSKDVDPKLLSIRPILQWLARISYVKTLPAGRKISYDGIYTTTRETVVATLPVGYADGSRRSMTGKCYVLLRGKRAPVLGRICMDQLMVDATTLPDISVDDEVTLFGRDGDATLPVEEYAARCHSFNYEAVCAVLPRVTRVYREK